MEFEAVEYRSPWKDKVDAVFEQPNAYMEKTEALFRKLKLEQHVWEEEKYRNLREKVIWDWMFHSYTCSPSKEIAERNPAYPIVILYSMFDLIQLEKSEWRRWMTDAAGFCLRYFDHKKETLGTWLENNTQEVRSFSQESQNAIYLYISCEKGYLASFQKKKKRVRPLLLAGLLLLLLAAAIAAMINGSRKASLLTDSQTAPSLSQSLSDVEMKRAILNARENLMIKLRKTPGLDGEVLAQVSGTAKVEAGVFSDTPIEKDGYQWIEIIILEDLKSDEAGEILVETEDEILPKGTICFVASDYLELIGNK